MTKMIEDQRITIRKMLEGDAGKLEEILNEPEVQAFYPMCNAREVTDALRIWDFYRKFGSVYTILVDECPAGFVVLYVSSYQKLRRQALFAIIVGREFRGKGLGTKLLAHVIERAKNEFGIKLLHLEMYEKNPALSLYERFGFQHYAEHKKFLKEPNGDYKSKIMMQLKL